MYAFNATTGDKRWEYTDDAPFVESSPAVTEDRVIIGQKGGDLHALKTKNGSEAWTVITEDDVDAFPIVADNTVIVGSDAHKLLSVATSTGERQ